MKKYFETFDKQILEGLKIGERFTGPRPKAKKILFCGMGGSAISGDVVRILISQTSNLSFKVNRTPDIPSWVDKDTYVIFSSYSGNSAEILASLEQTLKFKCPILIVSAGGKLTEIARRKNIPLLRIPGGMMPRFSIAYTTFALLSVFQKWGWFKFGAGDIRETISLVKKITPAQARPIAKKLHNKMVHFYACSNYEGSVLTRWRGQLAENAKMLSSHYLLPEMFHNEIEGWVFPKKMIRESSAVFIIDKEDPDWIIRKVRAVEKILKSRGVTVLEIKDKGRSLVARLFYLLVLGDWVSYELALMNKVDPMSIPTIESLKKII